MNVNALTRTLKLAFAKFLKIDGTQRAAAFAYYAFFSLFPVAVLFVAVGSLFVDRQVAIQSVIGYAESHVPLTGQMERQVFDTISGVVESRGHVGVMASVVLLWGSLQFFKALVRATNRAWNTDLHSWWQMPLKSLALLGVLASGVILGLAVPIGAKLVDDWLPPMHGIVRALVTIAIHAGPALVLFYGIALFYRLAPRAETHFSDVWPAALGVTLLLRLVETLFVVYLKNFGSFNVVYGTVGGIMAFLIWIYLSGCIVVFGACIGAAQAEVNGNAREAGEA